MGKCPSCGSASIVRDEVQGQEICTRCGFVLMEKLRDAGPEWHTKQGEESGRADVTSGLDITQHDKGLGSRIGGSKDLSPRWRAKLRRLQKWHRRSRATTYREKSLRQALMNIDKLCEDLNLPKSVRAELSLLYRKTRAKDLTSGRNTWDVLVALIFLVLRARGIPRTEKEVVKVLMDRTGYEKRKAFRALRRTRKLLSDELDLEVSRPKPEDHADRFVSRLGLPREVAREVHQLCAILPDEFKNNKASPLLAASSIYVVAKQAGHHVTVRGLSDEFDVGTSSISQTGRRIRELAEVPVE